MCIELKIKAKNLADEAKLIRKEELKRRQFLYRPQEQQLVKIEIRLEALRDKYQELKRRPAVDEADNNSIKRQMKSILVSMDALETRAKHIKAITLRPYPANETVEKVVEELISLQNHRKIDVGREARATNIARGFIKGLEYAQIEHNARLKVYTGSIFENKNDAPNWKSVYRMVGKYGRGKMNEFPGWMARAGLDFAVEGTESTRIETPKLSIRLK